MTRINANTNQFREWIKIILFHLCLVVLSAILFALSFPNPVFIKGVSFLAWFSLIPILFVISRHNLPACAGWGAIYGFTAYNLFNYWLGNFHPLAGAIVSGVYLVYLAAVFALFKLAVILFPKRGYLLQWIIWLAYEYLSTLGFLGYPYGVLGYSQWQVIPLIQIAAITGVWGVSALVAFPSFWISEIITKEFTQRHIEPSPRGTKDIKEILKILLETMIKKADRLSGICWAASLALALVFGFINMKDFSSSPNVQIALVQSNTDPWLASRAQAPFLIAEGYRKDLNNLIRLSNEALGSEPKPHLVVWPETAFIPRIYWHSIYRDDQISWGIVRDLLAYLLEQDVPFLIGNDDARMDRSRNPDAGQKHRVDYNAAMLYENGINTAVYRKMHLVPFTEYFPFRRQFPWIYDWLVNADTHFWEKGEEKTIFKLPEFSFASPICFEDSFGYISRDFTRLGANVLVNLSNDAWADSLTAQYQHLSMAVFRAVENSRSMVRSTISGQTCAIDPNGRIIEMAPPFKETWLNISVPLYNGSTIYTKHGDFTGIFFVILLVIILILGALWCTIKKTMRGA